MSFIYQGRILQTEYNYVFATLCGLFLNNGLLTEDLAINVSRRLNDFLETGEINRTTVLSKMRDPFMDFWSVYGGDIDDDDDIILVDDVEYCLEWLGKSEGLATSDGGN